MKLKYIIFFFIFFIIIVYIFGKSGNNINSKIQENNIKKIFSFKEYEAKTKVTVFSNKTINEYNIDFKENIQENYSIEIVKDSNNSEKFYIELKNNKLKIKNTKLNLSKIYDNYEILSKNDLFLSNFIKEADINNIEESKDLMIIKTKKDGNSYLHNKMLYIDKSKNSIMKMIIYDNEPKEKIIIEYNELQLK